MPQNTTGGLEGAQALGFSFPGRACLVQSVVAPSRAPGLGHSSLMMLTTKVMEEGEGEGCSAPSPAHVGWLVLQLLLLSSAASWCGSLAWCLARSSCS